MSIPRALTIAGSDSGGGAGIQADLKTFQELDVFGMSAITAVTVQNTLGVGGVYPLPARAVAEQIDAVGSDLGADALKTGMLFDADIIEAAAARIAAFGWTNVVVDPVMIAKGGAELLRAEAVEAMKRHLLPLARVATPNIPEAEVLAGMSIRTMADRREAAVRIAGYGAKIVVIKGGHAAEDEQAETAAGSGGHGRGTASGEASGRFEAERAEPASAAGKQEPAEAARALPAAPGSVVDLVYDGSSFTELRGTRIPTRHTHGTGCTFSAAIAARLAAGAGAHEAVRTARAFIQAAIEGAPALGLGGGHGPTDHWAYRRGLTNR
ncbi:bifunctional hydroxymethylpyrimidine kinase/phosphomethylpyrimidine kinase [Saccharibacillus sp. CPCC 101409]|uniref:bifunctional hydroxymethylpyrimidine kinase/phosphomethylpyrimidine kinase n=1 Tax=Saccharibacillus sp. CPCC 101409 TaxID=3058041 RepID=UPI002672058B|nr:bifunctional hydroxymethylpyrimidine kinase/phosphomethylpyrimidine kinase [Saccharibacillus sp. CPCC 101409]MDO3408431.1 bifunctional hydroxymethylpyrimidine kinase/phosphomethylpyrimidine kinase [Saccharibacillus sp. CPCC 101409]